MRRRRGRGCGAGSTASSPPGNARKSRGRMSSTPPMWVTEQLAEPCHLRPPPRAPPRLLPELILGRDQEQEFGEAGGAFNGVLVSTRRRTRDESAPPPQLILSFRCLLLSPGPPAAAQRDYNAGARSRRRRAPGSRVGHRRRGRR